MPCSAVTSHVELGEGVAHGEGGADRPVRCVLLAGVDAEHGHHGVADELLDDATVGLDAAVPTHEVGVDDVAHVLGVERLRQHGEVDDVREQDRDEAALLGGGAHADLVALGEERGEGGLDDGVAEHPSLRLEGRDGVVDRREIRHDAKVTERSARRRRGRIGRSPIAAHVPPARPTRRHSARPSRRAAPSAHSCSIAAASAGDSGARPSSSRQGAPAAASAATSASSPGVPASATASAHDDSTVSSHSSSPAATPGAVRRRAQRGIARRCRRPDLAHAGVAKLRRVVGGPAAVGGVPSGAVDRHRQQHALRPRLERDLTDAAGRVLPQRHHPGRREPGGQRTLDHAERGERQHGRAWVVGEHAGVPRRPPRRELGSVEQHRQHQRRTHGAQQVGDGVESGEVFADDRDDRDPAADLDELHGPARHLHRLPPAQRRVQRATEVVLAHLRLLERPPVVLVLPVVPPPPTELHADRHPVARLPVDVCRLADAGDEQSDAVTGEHRFDVVDRIDRHGALGQHDHVDDVDLLERGAQHAVEQLEVEPVVRRELEEAERLTTLALDRTRPRSEVAGADPQRPRQQQDVGRPATRIVVRALGRDLVPHRVDAGTAHAGVARQGSQ